MRLDEALYKLFLDEMDALDAFRVAYRERNQGAPLDREDPDVRRLIEAMAFFSARTRHSSEKHSSVTRRRMFEQFFSYLMSPLPAMAVIQAVPTGVLADAVTFPKGAEMLIRPDGGGAGLFQTVHSMKILPIELASMRSRQIAEGVVRLSLKIRTSFLRNDTIGRISFMINHINDFDASLSLHSILKKYVRRTSVIFESRSGEPGPEVPCGVTFGFPQDEADVMHPLERERIFFHFPWQDLYMNVDIPQPSRGWKEFTIQLDLAPGWPKETQFSKEIFHLFAVPVINLRKDSARPIVCDGTSEFYPIQHPDMEKGFEVHSIQGVFEVTKSGLDPIEPGLMSDTSPSWEVETHTDMKGKKHHRLNIRYPKAFEEARTLSVEARWVQPWFTKALSQRLDAVPFNRSSIGINWRFAIDPIGHEDSALQDKLDVFLRFLTMTNQKTLDREDLLDILNAIGITPRNRFGPVLPLLADVRTDSSARKGEGGGVLVDRYILQFHKHPPELEPLVDVFVAHVHSILEAWIVGVKIEVEKVDE